MHDAFFMNKIKYTYINSPRALNKSNATRIVRTTNLNIFSKRNNSRNESLNITDNV